jgi:hypothetical protein
MVPHMACRPIRWKPRCSSLNNSEFHLIQSRFLKELMEAATSDGLMESARVRKVRASQPNKTKTEIKSATVHFMYH